LLERLNANMLLVTRGSQGLALLERDGGASFIPIFGTDEIADVTGAGDTVISTFTLALASEGTPLQAATLANIAGGLVVMKRGTAPGARAELPPAVRGGASGAIRAGGAPPIAKRAYESEIVRAERLEWAVVQAAGRVGAGAPRPRRASK